MNCLIKMNDLSDVKRVSKFAAESCMNMTVTYKNTIVDPRSFLCLVALIGKEVLLVAPDGSDYEKFEQFVKKMNVMI